MSVKIIILELGCFMSIILYIRTYVGHLYYEHSICTSKDYSLDITSTAHNKFEDICRPEPTTYICSNNYLPAYYVKNSQPCTSLLMCIFNV